jgi:hypothetical protein
VTNPGKSKPKSKHGSLEKTHTNPNHLGRKCTSAIKPTTTPYFLINNWTTARSTQQAQHLSALTRKGKLAHEGNVEKVKEEIKCDPENECKLWNGKEE